MVDDAVAELLREVVAELRGIRAAVARRTPLESKRPEVAALLREILASC